jgi:hypothetical protein
MRVIRDEAGGSGGGFALDEDDIEELIDKGYLIRHTNVGDRGIYYTVTKEGRDICGAKKFNPLVGGDTGEETPHRVGVELLRRVLEQRSDISRADKYVPLSEIDHAINEDNCPDGYELPDEGSLDVVAFDDGEVVAVGEVESAMSLVESQRESSTEDRVGLHNYKSVRKDYAMLSAVEAESIWGVRDRDIGNAVLSALSAVDTGPIDESLIKEWKQKRNDPRQYSDERLPDTAIEGMNRLYTFRTLRDQLS